MGVAEPTDEANDGAPQLLKDLRWAYRNLGVKCCGSGQQEHWRKVLKRDPFKFADLFTRLDREFRQAGGKGKGDTPQAEVIDVGEEAARELIAELLDHYREKCAREDVELAQRPDAWRIGATLQGALSGALEREKQLRGEVVALKEMVRALGSDPHTGTATGAGAGGVRSEAIDGG